ncbi:helix-turn-helix domain-containing protein [Actinomadura namibiensis]|uniref:Transcriptional regulator with XRE-family HTH domain n=1 Tax=Actinomadura namibiensis TaxID=182080 RepID=A0A7W3QQC4_ACTNM|nr:helix-turn-helix transcriptional regulator [Actinomadura namibiensis]MBA8955570.1 transcriptional regulator with XRE-family HTH domain [Actinomadura namibiensis]
MGAWQALPVSAEPALRQLTVRLRELKDDTGLSLAALARRTPASKSAWGRYLNGQALPPRQVVAALGELAGADPARLMALWELAAHTHRQPDAAAGPPADPVTPAAGLALSATTVADGGPGDPEPADAPPGDDPSQPAGDRAPARPPRRRPAGSLSHVLALVIPTVLSTAALTIVITLVWHPGFGSAPPAPPSGPSTPPAATTTPTAAPTPSPRAAPTSSPRTRAPGTVAPVQRRLRSSEKVREMEGPYEPPIYTPGPEEIETWTDGPPQPPDPSRQPSSGTRRPSG